MENQASSKSIILNYGVYYGVLSIVIAVLFYALDMHLEQGVVNMVTGLGVMLVFIVLAQRKFKLDNMNIMSFGQAVKVGMGTVMLGAVISLIYNQIFVNFIEPDFMEQVMEIQRQNWRDDNLTTEQIQGAEEMARKFSGPVIQSAFVLIGAAFFGFIFSAISGAILKRTEEY